MTKKYVLTIAGVLLVALAGFLIFSESSSPDQQTNDQASQQHKDDAANEQTNHDSDRQANAASQKDVPINKESEEPATGLKEFLNDTIKRTLDLFKDKKTYVTAVGDSLTQGVGDDVVDGGYVGILDNQINKNKNIMSFANFGKRGNRSDQLLERLSQPKITDSIKHADMVLVTIGANDIMQVVKENVTDLHIEQFKPAKQAYKHRLQRIFNNIHDLNQDAAIYLIGIYNPFEHYFDSIDELDMIVDDWNETGQNITEEYDQAAFIPIDDLFASGNTDLFADDNFHPSHEGYQRMAKRVLNHIIDD
ncbi:hypothetical protein GCM10028778_23750 [Barrientosiimonas marina]|uniref:GDSL-type esterase/lipase family protein n=1 Tax=Lentibacillus kimchii TaxID=1542911 RepID=A0ABW2UVM8_9BACI